VQIWRAHESNAVYSEQTLADQHVEHFPASASDRDSHTSLRQLPPASSSRQLACRCCFASTVARIAAVLSVLRPVHCGCPRLTLLHHSSAPLRAESSCAPASELRRRGIPGSIASRRPGNLKPGSPSRLFAYISATVRATFPAPVCRRPNARECPSITSASAGSHRLHQLFVHHRHRHGQRTATRNHVRALQRPHLGQPWRRFLAVFRARVSQDGVERRRWCNTAIKARDRV
jgi:hypothetical protein